MGAHLWIAYLDRTRTRLGKIRVMFSRYWVSHAGVTVSVWNGRPLHGRLLLTWTRFSGSFTIPPLKDTEPLYYEVPRRILTYDLECKCDTVTYRYGAVEVTRHTNLPTDTWWIHSHTAFIWSAHGVRAVGSPREHSLMDLRSCMWRLMVVAFVV